MSNGRRHRQLHLRRMGGVSVQPIVHEHDCMAGDTNLAALVRAEGYRWAA